MMVKSVREREKEREQIEREREKEKGKRALFPSCARESAPVSY